MSARGLASALLFAWLAGGCAPRADRVMGQAPASAPSPVKEARAARSGTRLVLSGTMVEKCPVAGCWFDLRDDTGVIRVDTRNGGFVVTEVPLRARVTVAGEVRAADGEAQFHASGLRY